MESYFIFNEKNSTEMGLDIVEYPTIPSPEKRVITHEVDGRDGNLTEDLGTYAPFPIIFSCVIDRTRDARSREEIVSWLRGSGELILSHDPYHAYTARVVGGIHISEMIWVLPEFPIKFECQPFRHSANQFGEIIETEEKSFSLHNQGMTESKPIITLYGNGDLWVSVNGEKHTVSNVQNYVIINSDILETYDAKGSKNNDKNNIPFPVLREGENQISIGGAVSKIKIEPKWRWF